MINALWGITYLSFRALPGGNSVCHAGCLVILQHHKGASGDRMLQSSYFRSFDTSVSRCVPLGDTLDAPILPFCTRERFTAAPMLQWWWMAAPHASRFQAKCKKGTPEDAVPLQASTRLRAQALSCPCTEDPQECIEVNCIPGCEPKCGFIGGSAGSRVNMSGSNSCGWNAASDCLRSTALLGQSSLRTAWATRSLLKAFPGLQTTSRGFFCTALAPSALSRSCFQMVCGSG